MRISNIRRKVNALVEEHPLELVRKALLRVSFGSIDVNCLNVLEYQASAGKSEADLTVPLREASVSDIEELTKCQGTPVEDFLKRFDANDHCVVALVRGEVVGYEWFCYRPFCIEDRYSYKLDIPADTLYAYDAFVVPQYRRLAIWKQFHTRYLKDLMPRLDRCKVLAMVDSGNQLSMTAHLRLGYKLLRKVFIAKLFGRSFFLKWPVVDQKRFDRPPFPVPSTPTAIDARGERSLQS